MPPLFPSLRSPDEAQIVALGEATHGNREFQQLRLDVFQVLAEKYGVRAFALEGDFGGCEAIDRYIHGSGGTAAEALSATGFAIYRTEEMENLVEWMRDYNASTAPGEDLRFYGFDMEQRAYSYRYRLEALHQADIDTADFEKMWNSETNTYADGYTAGSVQRSSLRSKSSCRRRMRRRSISRIFCSRISSLGNMQTIPAS